MRQIAETFLERFITRYRFNRAFGGKGHSVWLALRKASGWI
jgi:hypothetical protein